METTLDPIDSPDGQASKPSWAPVPTRLVAREATLGAAITVGLLALLAPTDFGASLAPHPGWVLAFLLAARYGGRGLALALLTVGGTLSAASLLFLPGGHAVLAAGSSGANFGALATCVLVAWVSVVRERRSTARAQQILRLDHQSGEQAASLARMRDAVSALLARADLLGHSMTFLRRVASRLEGRDPVAGAEAALELAIARSGAKAGIVQTFERGRLRILARHGVWSSDPATGATVATVDRDDSDIAAPIHDELGELIGILALRGSPLESMSSDGAHSLGLIAEWCGKSLRAERSLRQLPPRQEPIGTTLPRSGTSGAVALPHVLG